MMSEKDSVKTSTITSLIDLVERVMSTPEPSADPLLVSPNLTPISQWSKEIYPLTIFDVLSIVAFLRDNDVDIGNRFTTLLERTKSNQHVLAFKNVNNKNQPAEQMVSSLFGYENNDCLYLNKDISLFKKLVGTNASLIISEGKRCFLNGYTIRRLRAWLTKSDIHYNDPSSNSRIENAIKLLEESGYSIIPPKEKSYFHRASETLRSSTSKDELLKIFGLRHQIVTKILSDPTSDLHFKAIADRRKRLSVVNRNSLQSNEGTHVNFGGALEPLYKYDGQYFPLYMLAYIFDMSPNAIQQIIDAKNINPGDDITRSLDEFYRIFSEDEMENLNDCVFYLYRTASSGIFCLQSSLCT